MNSALERYVNSKSGSKHKNQILTTIHEHLYPGRVEKLLGGGIDFVPDRREGYIWWDIDGKDLYDLHINGGTFNLGHRNPDIVNELKSSIEELDIGNHHFPSEHKANLAKALIENTPGDMAYVVFAASGSEANDVAVRSARVATGRRKVVALDCAYHGRSGTSGAVGDDENARYFNSDSPDEFIKVPYNNLGSMEKALQRRDIALVLMEMIPATAGFVMPEEGYLIGVKKLCEKYGTLFLADEVQTGLGRTGYRWACDCWGIEPDMMVIGKGLSGGMYPISALVMKKEPGDWLNDNGWGHVSTFGGSDIGCRVGLKALEISISEQSLQNARTQGEYIRAGLEKLKPRFPFFEEIRQQGLVFGLKFQDKMYGLGMMKALYENGIWAIAAGFDESVIQFKPGILVDKAYCDELLVRFENACIWIVNSINDLMTGDTISEDDPQVKAIKALAMKALKSWNLLDVELNLIKHRENSVFKVIDKVTGTQYVIRIHRPDYHTNEALESEIAWMEALNESGVRCPNVIKTSDGRAFVTARHPRIPDPRQCSLLEFIDGAPFDKLGQVENGVLPELLMRYRKLGSVAAEVHNQSENWQPPKGFVRHSWDKEGLLGEKPLWGRFWEHPKLTADQKQQMLKARIVLKGLLDKVGQKPNNYGLIHADFLPENILTHGEELRLIDFDDCGYGWHLFEMATSLFPQISQPYFDDLVAAYVEGYRSKRDFPEDQLEVLPAFLMIRGFAYIGWLMTRSESFPMGDRLAVEIAKGLCEFIPKLMAELTPIQRAGVDFISIYQRMFKKD